MGYGTDARPLSTITDIKSKGECSTRCSQHGDCSHWEYYAAASLCHIKMGEFKLLPNQDAIVGDPLCTQTTTTKTNTNPETETNKTPTPTITSPSKFTQIRKMLNMSRTKEYSFCLLLIFGVIKTV